MDFKKILANFDAVENDTTVAATERKASAGSMLAILESFNRVETDVVEETAEEDIEEAAKPDYIDIDGDGDKKESMKKAAKDKEEDDKVDEAVEEELEEAIMVSAEGDEAAQLLSILQLAGMSAPAPAPSLPAPMEPEMEPEMDMQDEYSNSPDEFEQDVDAVIASGDDMHREKNQYAATADGDNPMKAFEGKFKAIMDELLAEDEK